jgi:hypothetical protein
LTIEVLLFSQPTEHVAHHRSCRQPQQPQSGNCHSSLPSKRNADCCAKRGQIVDNLLIGSLLLLLLSLLLLHLCRPCWRKRGRRQRRGLLPLLIVKCPCPMADDCCATMPSSLDVDNNAWSNVIIAKMHAIRLCYYALSAALAKKSNTP